MGSCGKRRSRIPPTSMTGWGIEYRALTLADVSYRSCDAIHLRGGGGIVHVSRSEVTARVHTHTSQRRKVLDDQQCS